jgi:hypothetical protein
LIQPQIHADKLAANEREEREPTQVHVFALFGNRVIQKLSPLLYHDKPKKPRSILDLWYGFRKLEQGADPLTHSASASLGSAVRDSRLERERLHISLARPSKLHADERSLTAKFFCPS